MREWHLFKSGEGVLVCVSGGIDSVSLLHLILHLPMALRPTMAVAHFNHRLRGRGSEEDSRFVKELCGHWGIPFYVRRAPVWKTRSNLEARARKLRYDFFKKEASRLGIQKIVTAHQANDQAETFLIRWLQGAGLRGLSGIPLVRREEGFLIIRPLLSIRRKEIVDYVNHFKLPFRVDLTNKEEGPLRNRIRKWFPVLQKENPRLLERNSLNAIFLQADQAFLESIAETFFQKMVQKRSGGVACSLNLYRREPAAIRYRVLQRMVRGLVRKEGYALPAEAILKVDSLLNDSLPKRHYDLPAGMGLSKEYVRFELFRKTIRKGARKAA